MRISEVDDSWEDSSDSDSDSKELREARQIDAMFNGLKDGNR